MQRPVLAIGCVAIALLVPPAATAGGWWTSIRLDRTTVAVGEEVKAHANVMFSSVDAVEAEQSGRGQEEPFYVYLIRGFDYSVVERAMRKPSPSNWWSVGDADAYRVGRVVVGGSDSNLALANASFRVPDLPPGRYAVMFCNAGCAQPLADVIPTFPSRFTVVADPTTARLQSRVGRLEAMLSRRTRELARLEARLSALDRTAESDEQSPWAYAGWLVGGLALGALVAVTLRSRRRLTRTSLDTVALGARARSSNRGGRSPVRRRRSGGRSRLRA